MHIQAKAPLLIALIVGSTFGWIDLIVLPFIIGGAIEEFGVGEGAAGLIGAIEIAALTITSALTISWLKHIHVRASAVLALGVVVIGNALSVLTSEFWQLCASRAIVGAGLGVLVSLTNALAAQTLRPERTFAMMQFGLAVFAAGLIAGLPAMIGQYGLDGIFYVQILVAIFVGVSMLGLPKRVEFETSQLQGTPLGGISFIGIVALAALAILFVGHSALWAFAERVADAMALSPEAIGNALAISSLFGIIGAAGAYLLGMRAGTIVPIFIGFILQAIVGLAMYSSGSGDAFVFGVAFLNLGIIFLTPYMMGMLAAIDLSGRTAGLGMAFINVGSAFGPLFAGTAIEWGGYAAIGWAALGAFALGLIVAIVSSVKGKGTEAVARYEQARL